MTVANEILKVTANGNGSSTVFSFSPIVLPNDEDDLVVTFVATDGTETTLTRGVGTANYSVSLTSAVPSTGSITYPASGTDYLAAGEKLIMRRVLDLLQPTDLENLGGYFPDTQEGVFDRLTMLIQQQQEQIDRALKIPVAETGAAANTTLPSEEDGAGYIYRNASNAFVISAASVDTASVSTFMEDPLLAADGDDFLDLIGFSAFMYGLKATASAAALRTAIDTFEDVFTTRGDMLRAGVGGAEERVALGAAGYVWASDGTDPGWSATGPHPRGYVDGFIMSNNGSDANNDLDIAAGSCRDDGNAANITLAASITKRLDATWTAGTNQGGLDTGSEANSTWYHVFVIRHPTTFVVDVLFSTSASAPTMPSGYTQKRRIGAVYNDGSGNLLAFVQHGDLFYWKTPILDVDVSNLSTTEVEYALTVPTGVRVRANFTAETSTTARMIYIHPTDVTDQAPSETAAPLSTLDYVSSGGGVFAASMDMWMLTDTTGKIAARAESNGTLRVATRAWIDARGKDA